MTAALDYGIAEAEALSSGLTKLGVDKESYAGIVRKGEIDRLTTLKNLRESAAEVDVKTAAKVLDKGILQRRKRFPSLISAIEVASCKTGADGAYLLQAEVPQGTYYVHASFVLPTTYMNWVVEVPSSATGLDLDNDNAMTVGDPLRIKLNAPREREKMTSLGWGNLAIQLAEVANTAADQMQEAILTRGL
jgi:hypothetical protein